ncbi:MAG TPA: cell division protein FtsA [Bryobacteraceae bacterium]|nr:cell division protein FtsA [Bryobacteraceae bacterium]
MPSSVKYAVGLDVGSSATRCVICILEHGRIRLLGFGEADSRGWVKGRLSDRDAATDSIRSALEEAERSSQVSVEAAVLGIGGGTVEGANSRGLYEFGRPREIDPGDLGYAVELASRVRIHDDRFLLQVVPQDFTVDGRAGYRNPKGATCSRLEANVHVITTAAHEHHSLVSAVHQAHLAVEETIFEPVAAAYASILQEDRSRGVALVDIGAQSTELVVYDGDALLHAASLAVSGDHFTRDVAFGFTISYEDAENLKKEYGCAILGLTSDSSLIEVPSAEGRAAREATRRQLNEILEARAEELFLYVRNELGKVGMEQQLLEGIVLTGGGAMLNGMCDMAERVVNCQARNGLPIGIADWPEIINTPVWAAAAGLAMYSGKLKMQKEWKRKVPGIMGLVLR